MPYRAVDLGATSIDDVQKNILVDAAESMPLPLIAGLLNNEFATPAFVETVLEIYKYSAEKKCRFLFSMPDGLVLLDTNVKNPAEFYAIAANKPKVHQDGNSRIVIWRAIDNNGDWSIERKFSNTTKQLELYAARRLNKDLENVIGVLRVSQRVLVVF
jgi:hypothetical protein